MTKKDARRQKILTVSAQLFIHNGYERTSMDEIYKAAGCSKGTLYRYFSSKEALFFDATYTCISERVENILNSSARLKVAEGHIWQALTQFGISYLSLHLSPNMIKINRIMITESTRSDVGKRLYQCSQSGWHEVSIFIEKHMKNKVLRSTDPQRAAYQLKGLLDAGLIDKCLRGVKVESGEEAIQHHVEIAIDTFKRAYQS